MKESNMKWVRILLGLFLVGYSVNQFFHFLPSSYGKMPEDAQNFIDAVAIYLPFLYAFEMVIGLFLIINKWTAFILIVLFPLTVCFLIFTFANNDLSVTWPALVVAILNFLLIVYYQDRYLPLFK